MMPARRGAALVGWNDRQFRCLLSAADASVGAGGRCSDHGLRGRGSTGRCQSA